MSITRKMLKGMGLTEDQQISTHAPARGATFLLCRIFLNLFISTHAPARGATSERIGLFTNNSISTHAPARGATRAGVGMGRRKKIFLLTPLREGRLVQSFFTAWIETAFLLTPLREGRPSIIWNPCACS